MGRGDGVGFFEEFFGQEVPARGPGCDVDVGGGVAGDGDVVFDDLVFLDEVLLIERYKLDEDDDADVDDVRDDVEVVLGWGWSRGAWCLEERFDLALLAIVSKYATMFVIELLSLFRFFRGVEVAAAAHCYYLILFHCM